MRVLHTSFECYPLAKVGGLGDVVGSLPKYLNQLGCTADVVIPYHDTNHNKEQHHKTIFSGIVHLGNVNYNFSVKILQSTELLGFQVFLVDIPKLLHRSNVYGYSDDTERFVSFQLAILEWLLSYDQKPDIIHCHDHHTGLLPFLVSQAYKYKELSNIPTVLTIHNAQYQGQFSYEKLNYLPEFDIQHIGLLDWDKCINPLAAGIKCAWKVNTVSPGYMKELQNQANGLEGLLAHENNKCVGILNGIDHSIWNPETDPMVIKNYTIDTLISGRAANKEWICTRFNLDVKKPLFAFIGRMVYEKGADLLPDIARIALEHNDINILILGSGNPEVETQLLQLKDFFHGRYNTFIGYDEKLSHIIYAGADFLLMPSRVEPCGLNQMYALRYGLIPIVRKIGGLKDTIIDIKDGGFGICHENATIQEVCDAITRGVALYADQKYYKEIQKKIMKIDNSWNTSAKKYLEEYEFLNQLK